MSSKSVDHLTTYLNKHQLDETELVVRERRRRARVQVHWPICFIRSGITEIGDTVTQDLSSDGFYCLVNAAFVPGEIRECTLSVPVHHPNSRYPTRPVLCRVRVIRVDAPGTNGFCGVGCRIEDYHFISSGNNDSVLNGGGAKTNNANPGDCAQQNFRGGLTTRDTRPDEG